MTPILPPLPYATDALEPYIDRQTMELHYGKHHAGYVSNLSVALEARPELRSKSVEELLLGIDSVPADIRTTVRNNGGGHANHSLFWVTMGPRAGGRPTGAIADAIASSFGSFERFKDEFTTAGLKRFGSGWVWAVDAGGGRLVVESTANQDSPLMEGRIPVFGLDVWEHAYYLRYQNRRADYIAAWWHVVDWAAINQRFGRHADAPPASVSATHR